MRWPAFFILLYVMLGLQLGTGPLIAIRDAAPNLALILVIFVAANAPRKAALMAALIVGASQDLLSIGSFGVYAFSYGLVAIMVNRSRQVAFGEHFLAHFVLALGGGLLTALIVFLNLWLRPPGGVMRGGDGEVQANLGLMLGPPLLVALYTAALAPLILLGLKRLKPLFGFRTARVRW